MGIDHPRYQNPIAGIDPAPRVVDRRPRSAAHLSDDRNDPAVDQDIDPCRSRPEPVGELRVGDEQLPVEHDRTLCVEDSLHVSKLRAEIKPRSSASTSCRTPP